MHHVAELVPRHAGRTKKQEPATSTAAGSKSGKGGDALVHLNVGLLKCQFVAALTKVVVVY